jgi:hypothetical protein
MTTLTFRGALVAFLLLTGCGRVHLGTHDGGGDHDAGPFEPCGPTVCGPGTVCCNEACGICAAPGGACPAIACVEDCSSNADCSPTDYCARSVGRCSEAGTCVPRPTECPPVVRESCGCDGITYASPCDASASGVSLWADDRPCGPTPPCAAQDIEPEGACALALGVRWNGSECEFISGCTCAGADCDARFTSMSECEAAYAGCAPGGCTSSADCADGSYCHFEDGCGATGVSGECRPVPGELPCPPGAQPVCGCNDVDYACEAAANHAGVSAAHVGSCGGDCGPMDATGVGACFLALGYRWNGAACEFVGGCECEGADCARIGEWESAEECEAAHADCGGTCGGFGGGVCAMSEWCDFAEPHLCGGVDETGVCRPRPSTCETVLDPACGCDGVLYDNPCSANAAGTDTLADPDGCDAPPPTP